MHTQTDVFLKRGRERAVNLHHPWIFSGAIDRIEGDAQDGDVVMVRDAKGQFLARGYLNRQSQIVIRLLSWDKAEPIDNDFWQSRIKAAVQRRSLLLDNGQNTACRLIYAESDQLPGLIVDRYADFMVMQCLTLGIARRKEQIAQILADQLSPRGIYERSDVDVREREGLPQVTGLLYGEEPPGTIEILEHGHRFGVNIAGGQKTGFYLDQRLNRQLVGQYARGCEVLNAFCYSGAFSVYAAKAGAASITHLDASEDALTLARQHLDLNGCGDIRAEFDQGNAFELLRRYRDQARQFDLIVLDPPKFAPTRKHASKASRAYKDINLFAFKLLRPGGILFTFSCSGGIDEAMFQKIVFGASLDAGREVQVLYHLNQAPDHPILLSFPESAYLKGLVCRVI